MDPFCLKFDDAHAGDFPPRQKLVITGKWPNDVGNKVPIFRMSPNPAPPYLPFPVLVDPKNRPSGKIQVSGNPEPKTMPSVPEKRVAAQEANTTPFFLSQKKFHTVVLQGVRNIFDTL